MGERQLSNSSSPWFERYGSKGIAALERVLYAARQMGIITIVDCLHGGLPTTVSAFADVYFKPRSPLLADAITLLPYYGARSLGGVINDALNNGRGVFIASLTSNQEGASLQTAIRQAGEYKGRTVAYGIASTAQKFNKGNDGMGSVGLIIGATIGQWINDSGVDPAKFTGPILSPGYGWQGAETRDLKTVFKGTKGNVARHRVSLHRHAWSGYFQFGRGYGIRGARYSSSAHRGPERSR